MSWSCYYYSRKYLSQFGTLTQIWKCVKIIFPCANKSQQFFYSKTKLQFPPGFKKAFLCNIILIYIYDINLFCTYVEIQPNLDEGRYMLWKKNCWSSSFRKIPPTILGAGSCISLANWKHKSIGNQAWASDWLTR